jgi:alanine racemase
MKHVSNSTRVEVSRSAILQNLNMIRKIAGSDVDVCAVIKACAYGHGYRNVVEILSDQEIRFFGVHSIDEAVYATDQHPDLPILILGFVPREHLRLVVERGWRVSLFNLDTISHLAQLSRDLKKPAYVHLKLETGTNRQGFGVDHLDQLIELLMSNPEVIPEGAAMHFANIEDTTDHSYAQSQLERYHEMLEILKASGIDVPIRHTASSAASLLFEETHFDMIRFGISMYGLWPSKETYLSYMLRHGKDSLLKPALSWKTVVGQLKDVAAGEYIGYGCTYRTTSDAKIAIIPVGYYEGYDRKLSNLAHVLIRGVRAPVRGRICMNILMVDVTDIPGVSVEDEVVLIGQQGDERISAEQVAGWAGTINYEVVSRINPLLPRITVD